MSESKTTDKPAAQSARGEELSATLSGVTSHKRYMAFAGDTYYPRGGWNDLVGFFDTIEEAKIAMKSRRDWRQIIDTHTMKET